MYNSSSKYLITLGSCGDEHALADLVYHSALVYKRDLGVSLLLDGLKTMPNLVCNLEDAAASEDLKESVDMHRLIKLSGTLQHIMKLCF